jgi:hypothetical protein
VLQQPLRINSRLAMRSASTLIAQGLLILCLGCVLLTPPTRAMAQVGTDSLFSDDEFPLEEDELAEDSVPAKKVDIRTEVLDPIVLMNGGSWRQEAGFRSEDLIYPDLLERQGGFANSLGQWGMPYQRFKYGAEASNFESGNYINPITGVENVYFIDPEHGMRYFDTRTPYLNAYYGQGKADAAQMRVDVSQNVHPLVNVAALYYRQQCKGVYTNLVTDHTSTGLSSNFHTLDHRYQIFTHFLIQQHKDQINGGVILIESDSSLFGQGSQPVSLQDANLRRFSKAFSFRQCYRFTRDTLQARHTLLAYSGFFTDYLLNAFSDASVTSNVNTGQFPVYPTLGRFPSLLDQLTYRRLKVDGGFTYRLNTPVWKSQQRLEVAQELIHYKRFGDEIALNRSTVFWKGSLTHEPNPRAIDVKWTYRRTYSNLFLTERYGEVDVALHFPKWVLDYTHRVQGPPLNPTDSTTITKTHRPLAVVIHTLGYGRNPTLQQTYGNPWNSITTENRLFPNPKLAIQNRRLQHLSVGFKVTGKNAWTNTGEQVGSFAQLSMFTTRQTGMVYYAGDTSFVQAAPSEFILYAGAELKLRTHWKQLFLETEAVAQGFSTNSTTLDELFARNQPKFYSKSSIFYENRNLKFCRLLRFGVDLWYFSTYKAPYFEPASQTFYPQGDATSFFQLAYPRTDIVVATQIKKAFIFLKFINLLEGLPGLDGRPALGYFTTMGYPMQTRQLQLGLNWTFFD